MSSLTDHLKDLLAATADELPATSWRRMFGCDAVFAGGQIYGLIWKEGRLALRLPEAEAFDALRKEGSVPWTIGAKTMSPWLFVPEDWHDDPEPVAGWIRKAHALALQAPTKVKVKMTSKARTNPAEKAAPKAKPPSKKQPAPARAGVRSKKS